MTGRIEHKWIVAATGIIASLLIDDRLAATTMRGKPDAVPAGRLPSPPMRESRRRRAAEGREG